MRKLLFTAMLAAAMLLLSPRQIAQPALAQDRSFADLLRKLGTGNNPSRSLSPTPEETLPGCSLPGASDDAQIVLLSVYEGAGVSDVTIGSQDVEVTTAAINVEPGNRPIYLVVSSYLPVLWRMQGAVGRVQKMVVASGVTMPKASDEAPLAGVAGIPADKVHFLSRRTCLRYFTEVPSVAAALAGGAVRRQNGRMPDVTAAHYAVSGFAIPSGAIQTGTSERRLNGGFSGWRGLFGLTPDAGLPGERELTEDMLRYYPDGVVSIDLTRVTASRSAEKYQVLPNQAGLLQLVRQRALTVQRGEYVIRRKIRLPAALFGAHAVNFLLGKGVPPPDGDPGHGCVVSEETGEVVAGHCR